MFQLFYTEDAQVKIKEHVLWDHVTVGVRQGILLAYSQE